MKILAAADIHGAQFRMNLLLDNVRKYSPDLVIICGDITQFGPGDMAKSLLDQIPIETFAVTGNIDSEDVKKGIDESKAENIELKKLEKDDVSFVGINGSTPSDFDKIEKMVDETTVIVSHVPPKGLQDKIFLGKRGGSKELRNILHKYTPRLILCGHIHEDPGYTKEEDTMVINCSMGKRGEGALIDIDDKISVEML